ncbi:hypothetical protein BO79DRAFT_255316 [Aspergillus costaricaensis CBS 115574]|uniref:Uncharacterized protein n=1 Tax=Aspergillus costaricaensis CBS 115574 TaxID=1448317 RepID=A0ACD1IE10_9EURO|nr:hypothetical protein BO79DRAFT_255316 [Aspergillus costaricaensis CBS 115574]RAK88655.1 hypothetical protein BO79DRAFT_255316 [Aspergillus costaricaensis CBS 115574]
MPIVAAIEFGLAYCGLAIPRAGRVELISDEHGCRKIPCTHLLPKGSCSLDWRPEILSLTRGPILVMLQKLKALAETSAREPVDNVVLALPAFYAHSKRQLISDVAKEAGWNVLRLTSTAVAAVMGLFVDSGRPSIQALTLDAGSTRVDVTVVEALGHLLDVKCVTGRLLPRGKAYDQVGQPPLSTDEVNSAVFNASIQAISQALREADLDKAAVDEIILTGGSTNIARLERVVAEFLGKSPDEIQKPSNAGLRGAAIYAAFLPTHSIFVTCLC